VSTPKSKRKIDLSAIVEEENDTELPDILNVREKIDDINSNKSLPVKKHKIENVAVENNEIEKHKNYGLVCFKEVFRVKAESGAGSNSIS
jgi:hypothetical protein